MNCLWHEMTLCVVAVKIALIQALTCYEVAYASHCGGEKTSVVRNGRAYCYGLPSIASHQIKVRQSLAYTQKPPSDKWHNERSVLNVREP